MMEQQVHTGSAACGRAARMHVGIRKNQMCPGHVARQIYVDSCHQMHMLK